MAEGTTTPTEESTQETEASARITELATKAKSYMDTDAVRPAQFVQYERLLQENSDLAGLLSGVERKALEAGCKRQPVFPREFAKAVRDQLDAADIPPSHVWVKGLVASFLALQDERARLEASAKRSSRK